MAMAMAACSSLATPATTTSLVSSPRRLHGHRPCMLHAHVSHRLSGAPVKSFRRNLSTRSAVSQFEAVDSEVASKESSSSATSQKTTYYYLIANAKFMLDDEEHFQEQMQEKLRMYGERNKEQDFWMVIEPEFLDKHPEVAAKVGRPSAALVSTDRVWITFMKLRLDRVLKGELTVDSPEEALAGKLTTVKFERPEKWIAPYPKYEGDWWTPFLYKKD